MIIPLRRIGLSFLRNFLPEGHKKTGVGREPAPGFFEKKTCFILKAVAPEAAISQDPEKLGSAGVQSAILGRAIGRAEHARRRPWAAPIKK